jgi:diguanylate cyclase (GGDEF)-like protein/PAS domain S-box-containing protein
MVGGFSIAVLSEAARRRGRVLQWINAPEGPDVALRSGKVDVWHILTDIPERRKWAYMTDPWLQSKFVLIVPEGSAIKGPKDTAGRRVAFNGTVVRARLIADFFPKSRIVRVPQQDELAVMCRGEVEAAFVDMKDTLDRLLHRDAPCDSLPLDMIPLDRASYEMTIGATKSGFPAARELRAEITRMAEDHSLDYLYRKWLRDTGDETRIVSELAEARQRSTLFRYSAAILAAVVVLLAVLMYRERVVRQAVKSAYEFASAVLDTAGGMVLIMDRYGRIVNFNRACEKATGKTLQEIRNKTMWDTFVPVEEQSGVQAMFAQLVAGVTHASHENHWKTRDGLHLFSWSNTTLMNKTGRVDYIIATGIDISHREEAEQKLGYEATHDSLTNLPNRRQFLRELDAAFSEAQAGGAPFTLALADLDHFKIINDTYGHEAGDEVLVFLSQLFHNELGPCDLPARLGGDEFCLLIRSVAVESILERIRTRLLDHEFHSLSGKSFHASVTFGLAVWSGTRHQPVDLLREADQSLYLAKHRSPVLQ